MKEGTSAGDFSLSMKGVRPKKEGRQRREARKDKGRKQGRQRKEARKEKGRKEGKRRKE